jgi:hypothetical protein
VVRQAQALLIFCPLPRVKLFGYSLDSLMGSSEAAGRKAGKHGGRARDIGKCRLYAEHSKARARPRLTQNRQVG